MRAQLEKILLINLLSKSINFALSAKQHASAESVRWIINIKRASYHHCFCIEEKLSDESRYIVIAVDMMKHALSERFGGGEGLNERTAAKYGAFKC